MLKASQGPASDLGPCKTSGRAAAGLRSYITKLAGIILLATRAARPSIGGRLVPFAPRRQAWHAAATFQPNIFVGKLTVRWFRMLLSDGRWLVCLRV